ncbi:hypothetical protein B0H19DRAFT_1058502 [Mycena capillaripes]|nr:hypothetical protein B0H19DRAFT_1058502 [Mycena capillaripes]
MVLQATELSLTGIKSYRSFIWVARKAAAIKLTAMKPSRQSAIPLQTIKRHPWRDRRRLKPKEIPAGADETRQAPFQSQRNIRGRDCQEDCTTELLAGGHLESRRPSEPSSGDATLSPPALDLGPIDTGARTFGPPYGVESLGRRVSFWEPGSVTTHVATVHDAVAAGNQVALDVDHINTLNTYSILNSDLSSSALSDRSPENEDVAFDTTLTPLIHRISSAEPEDPFQDQQRGGHVRGPMKGGLLCMY